MSTRVLAPSFGNCAGCCFYYLSTDVLPRRPILTKRSACSRAASRWVLAKVGSKLTPRSPGLRITELHALIEDKNGKVYDTDVGGMAFADHARSGHVLVVQNFGPLDETLAHELGHECFLPHPGSNDGNPDSQAHDPNDPNCLMGSWDRFHFCGRCVLRLRGWSVSELVVDAKGPPKG